jgi:hypothetical protein
MKIDDPSSRAFSGTSPLRKLRAADSGAPPDWPGDGPDLSFLDLLTSLSPETETGTRAVSAEAEAEADKTAETSEEEAAATNAADSTADNVYRLPMTNRVATGRELDAEPLGPADRTLKASELSAADLDYLKQAVIPNLPILMGSMPLQSVFPTESDGTVSYRGFEVSSSLAELIEHGYKTGRPIRVEMDAQSAVVLKIRDGRVSAEFVSAEQGAVLALQQELNELRGRLAARNLPVGTLESRYNPDYSREKRRQPPQGQE